MKCPTRFFALIFSISVLTAYSDEKPKNILERKVSLEVKNASLIKIAGLIEGQEGIDSKFLLTPPVAKKIIPKIKVKKVSLGALLRVIRKAGQMEILITDDSGKSERLSDLPDIKVGEGNFLPATGMVRFVESKEKSGK